ncbi:MAG: sigma-54 dependent transcriptional regulator [Mariprofundales bacterium]
MATIHLLIIEHDPTVNRDIAQPLQQQGYHVTSTGSVLQAKETLDQGRFDAALINAHLPDGSGIDLLDFMRKTYPTMHCIIVMRESDPELTATAIRTGACDVLHYPLPPELLLARLHSLPSIAPTDTTVPDDLGNAPMQTVTSTSTTRSKSKKTAITLIGTCSQIQQLHTTINRLHDSNSTVLITGESGTGKEVLARTLHLNGQRAEKPFVSLNCGAIPEELLESELFGHVKGAFTGAVRTRQGRFSVANGGTIFLDEIGDMSQKLQVKLLRVLQERCFEPVGSHESVHVDVRVIAATHRDLEAAIEQGGFRQDLFYRLNVIPLELPPLRDRGEDIFLLTQHFIKVFNQRFNASLDGISSEAKRTMQHHRWPGNVRELQNLIERVATLKQEGAIELADLPSRMLGREQRIVQSFAQPIASDDDAMDFKQMVDDFERHLLLMALERFSWNKNRAAAYLSMNRTTLFEKLKKKELTPPHDD